MQNYRTLYNNDSVMVQLHSLVSMVRSSNLSASNGYKEHLSMQTAQAPIIHG